MNIENGRPAQAPATNTTVAASVQRWRRWRRNGLGEFLKRRGYFNWPVEVDEIDYHRDHLDRTVAERNHIGRELAAAGWKP